MFARTILTSLLFCMIMLDGSALSAVTTPPTGKPILRIGGESQQGPIVSLAASPNGSYIAVASLDRTVKIRKSSDGSLLTVLRPPIDQHNEGELIAVAISADSRIVACAGWTGVQWDATVSVYFFDSTTGKLLGRLTGLPNTVRKLAFSADGSWLAVSLSQNDGIRLYRLKQGTGQLFKTELAASLTTSPFVEPGYQSSEFSDIDFSPDSRLLAAISRDNKIRLYSLPTAALPSDTAAEPLRMTSIKQASSGHSIRFSPDGGRLAIGFLRSGSRFSGVKEQGIVVLKADNLETVVTPDTTGVAGDLSSVAWSKDGKRLYAGGAFSIRVKRHIRVWDNAGSGPYRDLPTGDGVLMGIQALPNNGIVAGSIDGSLYLLERRGSPDRTLSGMTSDFRIIPEFKASPHGDRIEFTTDGFGFSPHCFSLHKRTLSQGACPADTTMQTAIPSWPGVEIRSSSNMLSINKQALRQSPHETYYSGAFAPDGSRFVVGSTLALRCYDLKGTLLWERPANLAYRMAVTADNRLVIATLGDGTIRWYRLADGEELMALFPHRNGRQWVVWTPEGYFDAAEDGEELLGYHLNQGAEREGRFIPLNNLYDIFFRPDIVQARLRGDKISELIRHSAEEALNNPPPLAQITSYPANASDKAKVCYRVTSTGGGIGEVRVYQNGKLIQSDGFYRDQARSSEPPPKLAQLNSSTLYRELRSLNAQKKNIRNQQPTSKRGERVEDCIELDASSGENSIGVEAFNASNLVLSQRSTIRFYSSRPAAQPTIYILAIGISRFKDPSADLRYAAKDAIDFASTLSRKTEGLFSPQRIKVQVLTDQQAGRQGIMEAIETIARQIRPEDTFVLFAASHGILLDDRYSMLTGDYSGDLSQQNALITSHELLDLSKRVKALQQLFVFDTCHAGQIDNIVNGLYDARMSVLARQMGLLVFASSGSLEAALDGYSGNGLFTHNLLNGLRNSQQLGLEHQGLLMAGNLGRYAKKRTTEISEQLKRPQTPLVITVGKDIPLHQATRP